MFLIKRFFNFFNIWTCLKHVDAFIGYILQLSFGKEKSNLKNELWSIN